MSFLLKLSFKNIINFLLKYIIIQNKNGIYFIVTIIDQLEKKDKRQEYKFNKNNKTFRFFSKEKGKSSIFPKNIFLVIGNFSEKNLKINNFKR